MILLTPDASSATQIAYEWTKNFIAALPRHEEAFLNEATLAEATGTSRTPTREALLRLEAEGFVKRILHKGAYVPVISDSEVRAILQARSALEKWAVSGPEDEREPLIKDLQSVIDQQQEASDDSARFVELDAEFHTLMVRGGRNPILVEFSASLWQRQLRIEGRAVNWDASRSRAALSEHQTIVDALHSRNVEATDKAIDAHLSSTCLAVIGY